MTVQYACNIAVHYSSVRYGDYNTNSTLYFNVSDSLSDDEAKASVEKLANKWIIDQYGMYHILSKTVTNIRKADIKWDIT